jgi:hypothetical protein
MDGVLGTPSKALSVALPEEGPKSLTELDAYSCNDKYAAGTGYCYGTITVGKACFEP